MNRKVVGIGAMLLAAACVGIASGIHFAGPGVDAETSAAVAASGTGAEETAWYELPEEEVGEETTEEETEEAAEEDWIPEEKAFSALQASVRNSFRNKEYILKNSGTQFLEWGDVKGLSSDEITMARYEIYARHGYKFNKKQVLNYFKAKKWYKAEKDPSDFKEGRVFNDAEKYNVKYLESLETVPGLKNLKTAPAKKRLDSFGYENGYSRLSFRLKKGSFVKKNGYYEVTAVFRKAVTVPGDLEIGDSVRISFDDLKGKKLTLIRDEEGLYVKEDPMRQFEYFNRSGSVVLYEFSADRVDKPVYEGKLFIREDAVEGRWLGKTRGFRFQLANKKNLTFNAVTFDSKGYAVRLMTIGD